MLIDLWSNKFFFLLSIFDQTLIFIVVFRPLLIYWCLLVPTTTWKSTFFQHIFNKLHLTLYIRSDIFIIFCRKLKLRFLISHLKALYNCVTSSKLFIALNDFISRKCQININSNRVSFSLTKFLINLTWYIFT